MSKILDGRIVGGRIAARLKRQIAAFKTPPGLAIIQVGKLAPSSLYIRRKIQFAGVIGARVWRFQYPAAVAADRLVAKIRELNQDKNVHGIIVQLPLPHRLDKRVIIRAIDDKKDVDGLRADSVFTPATARGVLALLDFYKITLAGKKAVVVGRSALVGRPIALALLARNATVTICHRRTKRLAAETRAADILVAAAGAAELIGKKHVRAGQVIVDVGLTKTAGGLLGDVNRRAVGNLPRSISPVPGGVGPLTVASLFLNLADAYRAGR